LHELDRSFPPSYPYAEEVDKPQEYMESRCPAWCDRIILNKYLKDILDSDDSKNYKYYMIGEETCMGDHKVIDLFYINFNFFFIGFLKNYQTYMKNNIVKYNSLMTIL